MTRWAKQSAWLVEAAGDDIDLGEKQRMSDVLAHVAAALVFLWGASHVIPTRQVVAGFGDIGVDNRRIITMEWVAEGLSFMFVGVLVAVVAASGGVSEAGADLVYRVVPGFLLVIGIWTAMTGARTKVIWFKMCPVVMTVSSALLITASLV